VTLIAGFEVNNGVLLCSDSEYSGGTKEYKDKIFPHPFADGAVAFALSGPDSGTAAIEECRDGLALSRSKPYPEKTVRAILREAIKSTHERYVDSRPTAEEKDGARFDLIIAVAMKNQPPYLLWNNGPILLRVTGGFACRGSGWYLGDYIIKKNWREGLSLRECGMFALQALNAAKKHADGVGDRSV